MFNRLTLSILACCGLLLLASNDDRSPVVAEQPKATEAPAAAPAATPWLKNIHAVHVRRLDGKEASGTAVSIAPDTLITANHVTENGGGWAFVAVDRKWVLAKVQPLVNAGALRDGALLKIENGDRPSLDVREPEYREQVTVYGMKSKRKQRGIVVRVDTVSLNADESGIEPGDSGGAVVADDGCLIGIIKAHDADEPNYGNKGKNPRVVHFVPAEIFPHDGKNESALAAAPKIPPAQQPQKQQGNCPGGVCRPQQYQPFQFYRRR